MCIENLEKFDIRGDHGDQISLVPSFQFCRTQLSQGRKHLMPDDRQQLKRNKMVAVLFPIMQDSSHHSHHDQRNEQSLQSRPR